MDAISSHVERLRRIRDSTEDEVDDIIRDR
jgi:hypothetical protein